MQEKMRMSHTLGLTLIQQPPLALPALDIENLPVPPIKCKTINMQDIQPNITADNAIIPLVSSPDENNTEFEDHLGIPDKEIVSFIEKVELTNKEYVLFQTKKFKSADDTATVLQEQQITKISSPKIPLLFQGCKIKGNITININK